MATEESKRKIVQLNVGGTRYDVSRDTLERCEGFMLASLISGHWKEGNSDEPIFIDRSGLLFQYILDYLRNNKFHLPATVSRDAVKDEFEYYGIAEGISGDAGKYTNLYFLKEAESIIAASNQLAALYAAEEST